MTIFSFVENLVSAGHKYGVGSFELRYLRNKEKKEIDFLVLKNSKPWLPVEVKMSQEKLSENWPAFLPRINCDQAIQVINKPGVFKLVEQGKYKVLMPKSARL